MSDTDVFKQLDYLHLFTKVGRKKFIWIDTFRKIFYNADLHEKTLRWGHLEFKLYERSKSDNLLIRPLVYFSTNESFKSNTFLKDSDNNKVIGKVNNKKLTEVKIFYNEINLQEQTLLVKPENYTNHLLLDMDNILRKKYPITGEVRLCNSDKDFVKFTDFYKTFLNRIFTSFLSPIVSDNNKIKWGKIIFNLNDKVLVKNSKNEYDEGIIIKKTKTDCIVQIDSKQEVKSISDLKTISQRSYNFEEMIEVKETFSKQKGLFATTRLEKGTAIAFLGKVDKPRKLDSMDDDADAYNFTFSPNQLIFTDDDILPKENMEIFPSPFQEKRVAYTNAFIGGRCNEASMDGINAILYILKRMFESLKKGKKKGEIEIDRYVDWLEEYNLKDMFTQHVTKYFGCIPSLLKHFLIHNKVKIAQTINEATILVINICLRCFKEDVIGKVNSKKGGFRENLDTYLKKGLVRKKYCSDRNFMMLDDQWPTVSNKIDRRIMSQQYICKTCSDNVVVRCIDQEKGKYEVGTYMICPVFVKNEDLQNKIKEIDNEGYLITNTSIKFAEGAVGLRHMNYNDYILGKSSMNEPEIPNHLKNDFVGLFVMAIASEEKIIGKWNEDLNKYCIQRDLQKLTFLNENYICYGNAENSIEKSFPNALFVNSNAFIKNMDYNTSQYEVVWKNKAQPCLMYIVLKKTLEKGEEILVDYHYGNVDERHFQTLRKNIHERKRKLSSVSQYAGSPKQLKHTLEQKIITELDNHLIQTTEEQMESLESFKRSIQGQEQQEVIDKFSILEWLPSQLCVQPNLYLYPKKLIYLNIWPVSIVKWGYDISVSLKKRGNPLNGEWQFIDDVYIASDTGICMKGEDFVLDGDYVEFSFERKFYYIKFLNDIERESFRNNTKIQNKTQII